MMTLPNPFNVFPDAGGNRQTIDARRWLPIVSANFAGHSAVEREVNEHVASYGRLARSLDPDKPLGAR